MTSGSHYAPRERKVCHGGDGGGIVVHLYVWVCGCVCGLVLRGKKSERNVCQKESSGMCNEERKVRERDPRVRVGVRPRGRRREDVGGPKTRVGPHPAYLLRSNKSNLFKTIPNLSEIIILSFCSINPRTSCHIWPMAF